MGFGSITGSTLVKAPLNTAQNTIKPVDIYTPGITVTGVNAFQTTTADHFIAGDNYPRLRLNPSDGVWTGDGTVDPKLTYGSKLLNMYGATSDTQPRFQVSASSTVPQVKFGVGGTTAPDVTLQRSASALSVLTPASTSSQSGATWRGFSVIRSGAADIDGTGGGTVTRVYIETEVANATNGSRGDSITIDNANSGNHSSMAGYFAWGSGGNSFDGKGSLHHFYSNLTVDPYSGGGDVYCEGLNYFGELDMNRKGAYSANVEFIHTIAAAAPARARGISLVMRENNAFSSAYVSGTFGTSSWTRTGARAMQVSSSGSQRMGTGIYIDGGSGWEWFIHCEGTGGTKLAGIDGNGGVFTRTKAGVPVDGDFRQPIDGMLAVNTSTNVLYFRSGGVWRAAN